MRAFVDTGALLALSHKRDQYHKRAVTLAQEHQRRGWRYVSSTLVLSEFYSHLLYLRGPVAAAMALERLLDDPMHDWREVSRELVRESHARWIMRFADQPLSLVDAVSFEIMSREKLTHAFTFDRQFALAGFVLPANTA